MIIRHNAVICACIFRRKILNFNRMLKKLLFAGLFLANFSAFSQPFSNVISTAKLPGGESMILDVVDYNNDGFEDVVYQTGLGGTIEIYRNLNGVFSNVTKFLGFPVINGAGDNEEGVISFDYNNDGFQDLLVMKSSANGYMRLFKNNCGAGFTEVTATVGLPPNPNIVRANQTRDPLVVVSDYDGDKDNDIIYTSFDGTKYVVSLLKNTLGIYAPPADLLTGFGNTYIPYVALINYDNDQDEDLLLIKVNNISNACQIELFDNSGGSFTVIPITGIGTSSPVGFANITDINNDGFMDILLGTKEVVNPGPSNSGCKIFTNNAGDGTFTLSTISTINAVGADYYSSHVFDIDNDGDNDVIWEINRNTQTNSFPAVQQNDGSNNFTSIRGTTLPLALTRTDSAAKYFIFDFDNDGALDVFKPGTGTIGAQYGAQLYKNNFNSNNYINIKLLSCNGQADPIGARIVVKSGSLTQTKMYNSQGFTSTTTGKSEKVHFGLGSVSTIDQIEVYFQDNITSPVILKNVSTNQTLNITDGSCNLGLALNFDLGPDTTSNCNIDTAFLSAPGGFASYSWSNGDITPDTKITKAGWYFCTVTNVDLCSTYDSIYVNFGVGRLVQTDTTICINTPYTLDALPRFDCSPLGAPIKRAPLAPGENIGAAFTYVNSLNGHHYYRLTNSSNWTDAMTAANQAGGYLVVINDQLEQDFIANEVSLDGFSLWTGLYRTSNAAPFRWLNCDTLNYLNWAKGLGAPTNGTSDNFVYSRSNTCINPREWKNLDENATSSDPCETNIFGLVEFDASTNISYKWSNGDTTASTIVTPNAPSNYFVQITQNGANCFASINLNVIDPNTLFPADTLTECKSSFMTLQATPGMQKYKWSTGSTNDYIFISSTNANKWYSCKVTTPEGCIGIDSVYVVIFNTNIITPDTAVCLGSPVTIRGPLPPYAYQTDYFQNFQNAPFGGWNSLNTLNFNGSKVLGPFANDSITYNYIGLPAHDSVVVTFDLYIHDTWDGDCSVIGKDAFRFKNGNSNILNATFSNNPSCTQSYSASGLPGSYPATTDAAITGLPRRCDNNGITTKYVITKRFKHSSTNLDLSWVGDLIDTADNTTKCVESWSLDNIKIDIRRPANLLWSTGDSDRNIVVTPTDPSTIYWVRVPVASGFCWDTLTISTYTGQVPGDLLGYDTLRNCNSYLDFYTLPNNFDKYTWSNGDATQRGTFYNEGWYTGYVYSNYGCYGSDSVFVSFNRVSIVPSADTAVCYGSPLTIKANFNDDCSPFGAPASVVYAPAQAIPGYTYKGEFRGHHYYLADTHSSWDVAAQSALAAGGHLACINDTIEQNFIGTIVDSNAWLGLYNSSAGYYKWMNCDTLTYSNFAPGEPTLTPNDYIYMLGNACPEADKWAANTNSDTLVKDPCHSNIFGLLEIFSISHLYDWRENGVSTYTADSITIYPTTNASYRGIISKYENGPNCLTQTINVSVVNEFFDIIPDSVKKVSCAGDTAMIEAKFGYSNYHWDNGDTNRIAVYSGLVGWAYCIYDNGTCQFKDSVYVNVPGKLSTTPIVTDITCYGANDGIANTGITGGSLPYQVSWLHNGSTNLIEPNLAPGVYYFTVIDTVGCTTIDSVEITNPDAPLEVNFALLHGVGCSDDTFAVVVALPQGGAVPYNGNWIGYAAGDTLYNVGAGIYTYSITDVRGCVVNRDDTIVKPSVLDLSSILIKQVYCNDDTDGVVLLVATGGLAPYRYLWNYNLTLNDTIKKLSGGIYMAYVVDSNFCYDSVAVVMESSNPEQCGILVSSGFTPNGDGKNDVLFIKNLGDHTDNELTIFNRWGETVYQTTNYKNDWDGKPNKSTLLGGNDGIVPNDTYFYIFVTKDNNKSYSGYVYITK